MRSHCLLSIWFLLCFGMFMNFQKCPAVQAANGLTNYIMHIHEPMGSEFWCSYENVLSFMEIISWLALLHDYVFTISELIDFANLTKMSSLNPVGLYE